MYDSKLNTVFESQPSASENEALRVISLDTATTTSIGNLVAEVREECPSQIQSRYLSRLEARAAELPAWFCEVFWRYPSPLLVRGVPTYDDIEDSKILLLALGEAIGRCVGYSEYNQSYITDIRPTPFSSELSSGTELLSMHNDLSFASDNCRPAALVLVPHIAQGNVPRTLLARADDIASRLSEEDVEILSRHEFEIRAGGKLRWPCEQIRRLSVLDFDAQGRRQIRMSFGNIKPVPGMKEADRQRASEALARLDRIALDLGRANGHVLRKGEALFISNDYVLHGRDVFEDPTSKRMLLRSYVITRETALRLNGNTMLSLQN